GAAQHDCHAQHHPVRMSRPWQESAERVRGRDRHGATQGMPEDRRLEREMRGELGEWPMLVPGVLTELCARRAALVEGAPHEPRKDLDELDELALARGERREQAQPRVFGGEPALVRMR